MLILNEVNSDYNDIFKKYNWPHKPVRVFTYLIGSGKSKESEMESIACNNKGKRFVKPCIIVFRRISEPLKFFHSFSGYYEHIQKSDEIREKVLNYILVMARPLVMYESDHPIHWSSVYPGGKVSS